MAQLQTTPVPKGSPDIQEQPNSPVWDFGDTVVCTRTYEGPRALLHSFRPARGDEMPDLGEMGAGVLVDTVRILPQPGGKGRMIVTLRGADVSGPGSPEEEPLVEIDWQAVTKDLRFHPMYQQGAQRELTEDARRAIENALQNPEQEIPWANGSNADHLYQRLLRGFDTYELYAPIIRRTTYHSVRPNTSLVGTIQAPPLGPPGNWQYRKTMDYAARRGSGLWERREQWTGADLWDGTVYTSS